LFQGVHGRGDVALRFYCVGRGTIAIEDIDVGHLSIYSEDLTMNLTGVATNGLFMDLHTTSIYFKDSVFNEESQVYVSESNMSVEGSTFDLGGEDGTLSPHFSNISIEASVLKGDWVDSTVPELLLMDFGASLLRISNTTVSDIVLRVPEYNGADPRDHTLIVEGCEFTGDASVLSITYYDYMNYKNAPQYELKGSSSVTIAGNTFQGIRSGVVLGHPYHDAKVQENAFVNGAKMYAHYYPDISHMNRSYWFVNDTTVVMGDVFDGLIQGSPYEAYMDISVDPSMITHPGELMIAVREGHWGWPDYIIWFTSVNPTDLPAWIQEMAWGPFDYFEFYGSWKKGA
jgi:hypothetical protein